MLYAWYAARDLTTLFCSYVYYTDIVISDWILKRAWWVGYGTIYNIMFADCMLFNIYPLNLSVV